MIEDFDDNLDESVVPLIERFEEMLAKKAEYFFDVDEFEDIINFYLDGGDLKIAEIAINHAINQHPGSPVFMLKNAQLLASGDKTEKALAILRKVEDLEPENGEVYLTRGAIYSKLKQHEQAIAEFHKALLDSEELDEVYSTIAFEYEKLGDYDKAIENLGKALDHNPQSDGVINELAFCFEITDKLTDSSNTPNPRLLPIIILASVTKNLRITTLLPKTTR
mgnify:CR=1 FL=1